MAFSKGLEIPVTVTVEVLDENDEEKKVEVNFIVIFRRYKKLDISKVRAGMANIAKEKGGEIATDTLSENYLNDLFIDPSVNFENLLHESVIGWRNMPGPDGVDVDFSQEALSEAIEDPDYYAGLVTGLRSALGWGN